MGLGLKRQSGHSSDSNGAREPLPAGEGCGEESCDLSTKVSGGGSQLVDVLHQEAGSLFLLAIF